MSPFALRSSEDKLLFIASELLGLQAFEDVGEELVVLDVLLTHGAFLPELGCGELEGAVSNDHPAIVRLVHVHELASKCE